MIKWGKCTPDSSLRDGSWTAKSSKLSKSDGVVTMEEFSSADCSGTATETKPFPCGECTVMDEDDDESNYMIITCPTTGGVGDASGAFQLSSSLPLLTLLAVVAVKA